MTDYKLNLSLEEIELIIEALYAQTVELDHEDSRLNLDLAVKIKEQVLLD